MELVLEQTKQGTSYEVSVSAEGVEELKRKVKIKGEKKEALLTLRQKPGQYICYQQHLSCCLVFTMKMEILPVSTSNSTAVDSILQARNPVKEILLNLNLPDHKSILMDSKIHIKMVWRYLIPAAAQDKSRFIATCSYSIDKYKYIMKAQLKNIKKDGYTRFQHQEQYEHVGSEVTRSQEGKISQGDDKRLCLVDDLKKVLNHIHIKLKI
ncbi:hypothetical protein Tco_1210926 [Tanacetum coccineum]